jgi:hypothetical protein
MSILKYNCRDKAVAGRAAMELRLLGGMPGRDGKPALPALIIVWVREIGINYGIC